MGCRPILGILLLSACSSASIVKTPELVIASNSQLLAHLPSGDAMIVAGQGVERRYQWGKCALKADMFIRRERFLGRFGIYDGAGHLGILNPLAMMSDAMNACNGVVRTVVEEAQLHFSSQSFAERWIARQSQMRGITIWRNDGLWLGWDVHESRNQLGVEVYQICINGQRPAALMGANDAAIEMAPESHLPCTQASVEVEKQTEQEWLDDWAQLDRWKARPK